MCGHFYACESENEDAVYIECIDVGVASYMKTHKHRRTRKKGEASN